MGLHVKGGVMFENQININLNDLSEGRNSVPGERQFGFRDLWTGLLGDLSNLAEDINKASADAELAIDWRRGF